jgi:hypothetical protein
MRGLASILEMSYPAFPGFLFDAVLVRPVLRPLCRNGCRRSAVDAVRIVAGVWRLWRLRAAWARRERHASDGRWRCSRGSSGIAPRCSTAGVAPLPRPALPAGPGGSADAGSGANLEWSRPDGLSDGDGTVHAAVVSNPPCRSGRSQGRRPGTADRAPPQTLLLRIARGARCAAAGYDAGSASVLRAGQRRRRRDLRITRFLPRGSSSRRNG